MIEQSLCLGAWIPTRFRVEVVFTKDYGISTTEAKQSLSWRPVAAHMTESEKSEASRRGRLYGVWVFATSAGPLALMAVSLMGPSRIPALETIAAVFIAIPLFCIPGGGWKAAGISYRIRETK